MPTLHADSFPSSAAFDAISQLLQADAAERKDAVKNGNAIFSFNLKNTAGEIENWYIDLKKEGAVGKGEAPKGEKADGTAPVHVRKAKGQGERDEGKIGEYPVMSKADATILRTVYENYTTSHTRGAIPVAMSKRVAETELTKDSKADGPGSYGGGQPQRATAAQMAARNPLFRDLMDPSNRVWWDPDANSYIRLAKPRGARRPGATSSSLGLVTSSGALQQQRALPAFDQLLNSQQSGSTLGQQNNTNNKNETSASFPPFGGSISGSNSGFNNPFTAPSGSFSFNAPPVNNPFSNTTTAGSLTRQTNGFQGSIFNLQTPSDKDATGTTGKSEQSFAPKAPSIDSEANGSTQNHSQSSNNGFTWPSSQQPQKSENNSNIFQQPSATSQQQSSILGNSNKSHGSDSGSLANMQSSAVGKPEDKIKQPTSDIFAHLKTPQAKAAENPFAASIAKFQQDQNNQPKTSMFGSFNQQPTQPPSNLFAATTAVPASSPPNPSSSPGADAMQTSPDTTPQKESQTQLAQISPADPSSNQQQSSPTEKTSNSQPTAGSAFGTISTFPSQAPSGTHPGLTKIDDEQPAGGGLFDRVSSPQGSSRGNITNGDISGSILGITPSEGTPPTAAPTDNSFGNSKLLGPSQGPTSPKPPLYETSSGTSSIAEFRGFPKSFENIDQAKADADYEAVLESSENRNSSHIAREYGPGMPPPAPSYFTAEEERHLIVGYRLKQLDIGMHKYLRDHPGKNTHLLRRFHEQRKQAILAAGDGPVESLIGDKRKASSEDQLETPQAKKQKQKAPFSIADPTPWQKPSPSPSQTASTSEPNQPLQPLPTAKAKRKADEESARDGNSIANQNTKRVRGPDPTPKSQTSSLFSNILEPGSKTPPPEESRGGINGPTSSTSIFQPKAPGANNPFGAVNTAGAIGPSLFQPKATMSSSSTENSTSLFKFTTSAPETPPASLFRPLTGNTPSDVSPAASPVTFKPQATNSTTAGMPSAVKAPSLKPPSFGIGASTNFLAQFGNAAKTSEEEAKKKRKAEEFDSEEEDEAAWEQRDAEEQQKKKQRIEEAAKAAQKFVPQLGPKQANEEAQTAPMQKSPVKSIFDQTHPMFGNSGSQHNIFGHLAKQDQDVETGKNSEADDEDDGEDDAEEDVSDMAARRSSSVKAANPTQPLGRSLFDRVSNPAEDLTPKANAPGSEVSPSGDHTWKVNSPIKFGASTDNPHGAGVQVPSASPSKTPFTGLFGASKLTGVMETPTKPGASIFSNIKSATPGTNVGFGFSPAKTATNTLALPSNNTSRATSPGATTAESANESAAEGTDDSAEKQNQLDLMSDRAGEEDEDVLFEVKAKGLRYDVETKQWISKGVGPLRVLKHRETGKPRIVLRAEPSGRVVINSGFVKEGSYENLGCKTVAAPIIADGQLGPWRLRVGNDNDLKKLWETLDENKKFA
ncbi:MAG: hypothetical protein Q9163_001691 [Psora crenata]